MPYHFDKWRQALQLAPSERAVLGILKDYLATLSPEALALLPDDCRSALLDPAVNPHEAAITLLHAEMKFAGSPEAKGFLHEIAHTFAAASVRLTVLHDRPAGP